MTADVRLLLPTVLGLVALFWTPVSPAAERVLEARIRHVRLGDSREWSEFPEESEGGELTVTFTSEENPREWTLRLRHRDVKQAWTVSLNGDALGRLPQDENPTVTFWAVPPRRLRAGENVLRVAGAGKLSDDILVGDVRLLDRPRAEVLAGAPVEVVVNDESGEPLPCRLTLVDEGGALMSVGHVPDPHLAVRPGVVYTATGLVRFTVPAGRYTLYAGRGFEYGVDSAALEARAGEPLEVALTVRREVDTAGWVGCDTHCHTLTHSGHGDATLAERVVTVAGEGVELPVAADHNVQVDYEPAAREAGVRRYFTPVIGNEVTTPQLGHFNAFPIDNGAPVIDYTGADWPAVFRAIRQTPGVRVVVLNHARDLHGGFRPFGPRQHIGVAGENLDGRELRANAIEVVNSGATQTDPLQLLRDWFGLLNRGLEVAPVGASDSHDVARHFVGQARTYVRCEDRDPGRIDVRRACEGLAAGRVLVSYGLLCDIRVNGEHGPGDLAPRSDSLDVSVRVSAPSWSRADHVALYANGVVIREADIDAGPDASRRGGVRWERTWSIPRPAHDVHLAAVATGPGVRALHWPIAKPYQPTSIEWEPRVLGSTGAVRVDADGSGEFDSAHAYAERLWRRADGELPSLVALLADYDEAVAAQAASLVRQSGVSPLTEDVSAALRGASSATRRGFKTYADQWRGSQIARSAP